MKNTFRGYYRPTEKQFAKIWDKCIFVPDANVLLNLYRYSEDARDTILSIFEQISERLWIPHQAAYEYHKNRPSAIEDVINGYDALEKELGKIESTIENTFSLFDRLPSQGLDPLVKKIQGNFTEIRKDISKRRSKTLELLSEDAIQEKLSSLFEGKVGPRYKPQRLDEISKEGEERFSRGQPPGYKDNEKEGLEKYGDLIIWNQLIDHAKEKKNPIIFITDDNKEDWWWRPKGKTRGPRPELIEEMYEKAKVRWHAYQPGQFMGYAQTYLKRTDKVETIEEVQEVEKRKREFADSVREMIKEIIESNRVAEATGKTLAEKLSQIEGPSSSLAEALSKVTAPSSSLPRTLAEIERLQNPLREALSQIEGPRSSLAEALFKGSSSLGKTLAEIERLRSPWEKERLEVDRARNLLAKAFPKIEPEKGALDRLLMGPILPSPDVSEKETKKDERKKEGEEPGSQGDDDESGEQ